MATMRRLSCVWSHPNIIRNHFGDINFTIALGFVGMYTLAFMGPLSRWRSALYQCNCLVGNLDISEYLRHLGELVSWLKTHLWMTLMYIIQRIRQKVEIIRLWNRIINMDDERIPDLKAIFNWEYNLGSNNWCKSGKHILTEWGLQQI